MCEMSQILSNLIKMSARENKWKGFFGSVHTRDESPIGRLQQNLEQIRGSPARVVVSAGFLSSSALSYLLSALPSRLFSKKKTQRGCSPQHSVTMML